MTERAVSIALGWRRVNLIQSVCRLFNVVDTNEPADLRIRSMLVGCRQNCDSQILEEPQSSTTFEKGHATGSISIS